MTHPASPDAVPPADLQARIASYLEAFAQAADGDQLLKLWTEMPGEFEHPFFAAVEARITQADQAGATDLAEGLRRRRDGLQAILVHLQQAYERMTHAVQRLEAAEDNGAAYTIWNEIPDELHQGFLVAAEQRAAAMEDVARAERMRSRVASLRQYQQELEQLRQSPTVRAIIAFLRADDTAAARQVFANQQALLRAPGARHTLDLFTAHAAEEWQALLAERTALLRELMAAGRSVAEPGLTDANRANPEKHRGNGDGFQP